MRLPVLDAVIRHRLLLNLRADPSAAAALLPSGLEPQLVDGSAVVGVCIVGLDALRPPHLPRWVGLSSDSAAHRIAVLDHGRPAVFVARRDTSSWLATAAGGRAYPGVHRHADVHVHAESGTWEVSLRGAVELEAVASAVDAPTGSLFASVADAATFFGEGSTGLSPARRGGLEAIELEAPAFRLEPLRIEDLRSSWFDEHFPPGTLEVDAGFVLRDVPVRWRARSAPQAVSRRDRRRLAMRAPRSPSPTR
ncbi:MAG: hypothetical protein JWN67_3379 [Actinomycetia bacterium]|nr:hypothetical protein [Actinomycetes bacterium]